MPALIPMLPVLIPAMVVTFGWIVLLRKGSGMPWRMALLTASLAVFLLSIAIGLARYHQFGTNVRLSHNFVVLEQLSEMLRSAVSIIKLGVGAMVLHLLLAAWVFKNAGDCGRSKS